MLGTMLEREKGIAMPTKHKEDNCRVPFCGECFANIKRVKKIADDFRAPTNNEDRCTVCGNVGHKWFQCTEPGIEDLAP